MAYIFEPDIEERIEAARVSAQKILNGEIEGVEDFRLALRYVISRSKGMGIFDEYFDKRTLDELVFEAELVQAKPRDNVDQASKMLKDKPEEAKDLFADWDAEDAMPVSSPAAPPPEKVEDSQFYKDAVRFMETDEFKDEEGSENVG